jgi:hypothetical protein
MIARGRRGDALYPRVRRRIYFANRNRDRLTRANGSTWGIVTKLALGLGIGCRGSTDQNCTVWRCRLGVVPALLYGAGHGTEASPGVRPRPPVRGLESLRRAGWQVQVQGVHGHPGARPRAGLHGQEDRPLLGLREALLSLHEGAGRWLQAAAADADVSRLPEGTKAEGVLNRQYQLGGFPTVGKLKRLKGFRFISS